MNIGFLGCSKIGTKVIEAIKSIEGATLYGCSARDALKAKEYKEKYGFLKYYESYEEMLNDPQIELVYVSTLMTSHYKDTLLALKHNKSCIVEKSFTTINWSCLADNADFKANFLAFCGILKP